MRSTPSHVGLDVSEVAVPGATRRPTAFHLVAAGAKDATVVVVGEAPTPEAEAAARKAFARFAPYTDEPLNLLTLVHGTLKGKHVEGITAACLTFDPRSRRARWASAGHALPVVLETGEAVGAEPPAETVGGDAEPAGVTGELHLAADGALVFRSEQLEPEHRTAVLRGLRGLPAGAVRAHATDEDLQLVVVRAAVPPRFESRSGTTRERTVQGATPAR